MLKMLFDNKPRKFNFGKNQKKINMYCSCSEFENVFVAVTPLHLRKFKALII